MSPQFITYKDVCKKATKQKEKNILEGLHKQKKFKEAFNLIFKFTDISMADVLLHNWENAIKAEVKNCDECDLITEKEAYQIERISLKELTVIANLGKYCITNLKMKPHTAMAFTLGIYYGTYIFEQTGMYLTIDEIYSIIPEYKRTKNGCKTFTRKFFIDGTSNEVIKILSPIKEF